MAGPLTDLAALDIRPIGGAAEAHWCAQLMASSEPWLTLGRDYDASLAIFSDKGLERYIAILEDQSAGFVVIDMRGSFPGYIKSVAVAPPVRNRGIGRSLLQFAERRIFREQPNVFLCVSSFNPHARRLYQNLGYEIVGLLTDYVLAGHGEYLLRKSIAPISAFNRRPAAAADGKGVR